jgi:hypothetical protein
MRRRSLVAKAGKSACNFGCLDDFTAEVGENVRCHHSMTDEAFTHQPIADRSMCLSTLAVKAGIDPEREKLPTQFSCDT